MAALVIVFLCLSNVDLTYKIMDRKTDVNFFIFHFFVINRARDAFSLGASFNVSGTEICRAVYKCWPATEWNIPYNYS